MLGPAPHPPPPHCPNPGCDSHADPGAWRYTRKGVYRRRGRRRPIQRYRCRSCGRSFSSQTFSVTYWLRRPGLLPAVFHRATGCSGLRQIAREFAASPATIQRHLERLGRHCLLLHEQLRPRQPAEPVALDGLHAIESGRTWPFDLQIAVGASHFVYGVGEAERRRSGRMTAGQRRHRAHREARYGRPDPRAVRRSVAELVARILPPGGTLELHTDEHTEYPPALATLADRTIHHHRTSSRAPRTTRNPLFPVNLADLLLRHSGANHKRQTLAFSKRRQGAMYRAWVWVVWRNYVQWASERRRTPPPGVQVGALVARMTVRDVLARRLFPWRQPLTGWLRRCYHGEIPTRSLPRCARHTLRYAV